jgi:hypothetical protein
MNCQNSSFLSQQPPWIEYLGADAIWGGWRQGSSEAWLNDIWLPFWNRLSTEDRERYLKQWPTPNEEWNVYLTYLWKQTPESD